MERIGYRDYAQLAWMEQRHQERYDDAFDAAERMAREAYTPALGREFVTSHLDEWLLFIDGMDEDEMRPGEEAALLKEFCLDDIDEWREFVA